MIPAELTPFEIALLLYPGIQIAALHGLTDLFALANKEAATRATGAPHLRVTHWARLDDGRFARSFDTDPGLGGTPRVVILPPTLNQPVSREVAAPYGPWLKAQHAAGATLGSVCAGAFVLAESGVLAGRTATTHWAYAEALATRFPDVHVDPDKLVIDDGDIITAGGYMAWTDLGLKLVERVLGPSVMMATARFMLVDPPGREQRFYSPFAPPLRHGDKAVLKVQHWLRDQHAKDVHLPDMAAQAGLEERTFLRRFRKATGMKPIEYCQYVRVGKAREMLELSASSVEQIAREVGYEDAGAFRRVFAKVTGLSPGDYRRRFAPGLAEA
ncbi:GlxA family transcriptional regulator [Roseixanthobacter pseudopolyaromaticivorans]|uniref:GlxA family transcriptional regulator n=1 Tax=Xanthobacteraceae TaxID=335928 RepID=UPI00372879D7